MHDDPRYPSGTIGYHAGPILSNSDAVTIRIFGRGGHGARPETTVDPVVIAARTVLALQTIVSREISPFDPAVITVGAIHGGTKRNIIPDEVRLDLTVRSFTDPVRQHLLLGDRARREGGGRGRRRAEASRRSSCSESTYALVNDSALTGAHLGDADPRAGLDARARRAAGRRRARISPSSSARGFRR